MQPNSQYRPFVKKACIGEWFSVLGKCSAAIEIATVWTARIDDADDNVLSTLERGHRGSIIALVVDGCFVDLVDDSSLCETDLIGERTRLHFLDQHAVHTLAGQLLRQIYRSDTEFVWSRFFFTWSVWIRRTVRSAERADGFGAVLDGYGSALLLTVAQVADLGRRAWMARGDDVDQIIAVLDGSAIDGDDDVTHLDAGLFRRSTLRDARN